MLHCCVELDNSIADPANRLFRRSVFQAAPFTCIAVADSFTNRGTARDLLWRYLFPVSRELDEAPSTLLLNRNSRERLYNVIFELVKRDGEQFKWLLDDLKQLVPYDKDEDGSS